MKIFNYRSIPATHWPHSPKGRLMVHPLDLLEWGWSPEWFFISPFLIETAISKNLVKKKIQGSGNVVVKYIAVFLSIFMFESVWIWAKTTRCFRCQGAWLWVIYSPLRNIVCVYVQTWIYIYAEKFPSLELENVGGWYLWKTVQIKRGGKRTLAEHLQLSICRGQSLYRGESPLIFTPSLQSQKKLGFASRLRDSQTPAVA